MASIAREHCFLGNWAKAARAISSLGMADTKDPSVLSQLKTLFPPPSELPFPALPDDSPLHTTTSSDEVVKTLSGMDKSAAGGVSQWTTPLLLILMDNPSCAKMITSIITRLKNGNIPARAAPYFRTSRLVTPYKPKGGIRPIGMTDILLRVTCKILTNNLPPGFKVFAEGIQFAIRIPGGSQTAAHRIQAELVRRRLGTGAARIFMFTVDFLNAFNERDRSAMAKILFSDPVYRSIFRVFNFSYSSSSTMLTHEGVEIECANGVIQGEVLAMEVYSKSVDHVWQQSRDAGRASDPELLAAAIADDGAFVGTFEGLQLALAKLKEVCNAEGIKFTLPKFVFLDPLGDDVPTPPEVVAWVAENGMQFKKGAMMHLGAPIGLDDASRDELTRANIAAMSAKATALLESSFFPSQCVPGFAAQAARAQVVHVASVADVASTRPALQDFGVSLRESVLKKFKIEESCIADCKDDVLAQLQISKFDGGYGISSPDPALLSFRSMSRAHSVILRFQPDLSLLDPLPLQPLPPPEPLSQQLPAPDDFTLRLAPNVRTALHEFRQLIRQPRDPTENESALISQLSSLQNFMPAFSKGFLALHLPVSTFRTLTHLLCKLDTQRLSENRDKLQRRLSDLRSDTARRFLSMLPHHGIPELRFSDSRYNDVMRALLSIRHRDIPFDRKCVCNAIYDSDHAHRCKQNIAKSVAARHHAITHTLQRICNKAGIMTTVEPRANHFGLSQHRGDILMDLERKVGNAFVSETMVDVAFVHAECYSTSVAKSLAYREKQKTTKYQAMSVAQQRSFVPFVLSTFGTISPSSNQLLISISKRAFDFGYTTDATLFYRLSVLSVLSCLHRFNIGIQESALRNLPMHDAAVHQVDPAI